MHKCPSLSLVFAFFLLFSTTPAFAGFEFSQSASTQPIEAQKSTPKVVPKSKSQASPAVKPISQTIPSKGSRIGVLSVAHEKLPLEKFTVQPGQVAEDVIISPANPGLALTSEKVQKIDFKTPVAASEIFARIPPEGWVVIAEQSAFNYKTTFVTAPEDSWIVALKTYAGKTGNKFYVSPEEKTIWVMGSANQTTSIVENKKNEPKISGTGTKPVVKKEKSKSPIKEKELSPVSGRAMPVAAPVTSPAPIMDSGWNVSDNASLKRQIESWCAKSGYKLLWEARTDFLTSGQMTFSGTFEEAVVSLFGVMYKNGRMPLRANIYRANKVIRVSQD